MHRDYLQRLDLRTGVLTTQDTWEHAGHSMRLKTGLFVSRSNRHLLVIRVEITPSF